MKTSRETIYYSPKQDILGYVYFNTDLMLDVLILNYDPSQYAHLSDAIVWSTVNKSSWRYVGEL